MRALWHLPAWSLALVISDPVWAAATPPNCVPQPLVFYAAGQNCPAWWNPDGTGMRARLSYIPADPDIVTVVGNPLTLPPDYPGPFPPPNKYIARFVAGSKAGTTTVQVLATHPDGSQQFYNTWTVVVNRPMPVNFRQVGPAIVRPGGVLRFNYAWESSTGNLADLTDCMVGEKVTYPGGGDPFVWPKPPYDGSTPNPTITWASATLGRGQDNHSPKPFFEPYAANRFSARQNYRYRCAVTDATADFPGQTGIVITRQVRDKTGRGCWGYTVQKSGAQASVKPLPGVDASACTRSVESVSVAGNNAAGVIAVSVSPAKTIFGLHEPVFADLTLQNASGERAQVDLGLNRKANIELSITAPGRTAASRKRISSAGFGAAGEISLPPHANVVQRLLLNEWDDFSRSGTYAVKLTVLDGDLAVGGPSTEFSVQIGPRDPAQLRLVVGSLADKAIAAPSLEDKAAAALALSHVVDSVAVSDLTRVVQQSPLVAHYAVDGLARIGTPDAMRRLATVAQGHADADTRLAAQQRLTMPSGAEPAD